MGFGGVEPAFEARGLAAANLGKDLSGLVALLGGEVHGPL